MEAAISLALTPLQKATCKAIVSIFETGSPRSRYDAVTVARGDRGGLSYGHSQATLMSGNLAKLVASYIHHEGAFADVLAPYLPMLRGRDARLNADSAFHTALRAAAEDPVMRRTQDTFFDTRFWTPAASRAERMGFTSALSAAVVYDSYIHGSFDAMARRTDRSSNRSERAWIPAYLATRRAWLASHSNQLLRKTVYRIDSLMGLTRCDNWMLALPLVIRGTLVTPQVLAAGSGPANECACAGRRLLRVVRPYARGEDVRCVQRAVGLSAEMCDGIYGPNTARAVALFQQRKGLAADGITGPRTWRALEAMRRARAETEEHPGTHACNTS